MHSREPIVYEDVTVEHFTALEKLAQSHSLSVVGVNGRTQKDGYDVSWAYDEDAQTLTITVNQSPFYMPESLIEDHFDSWVKKTEPAKPVAAASTAKPESGIGEAATQGKAVAETQGSLDAAKTENQAQTGAAQTEPKQPISPK